VTTENDKSVNADFRIADRSADHWETSNAAQVLKRLQANPRVKYIVLAVPIDACPVCKKLAGAYRKDKVPPLPVDVCSHPLGCRAYYIPNLDVIYP
jgi:hypothetical protein